jgi:uncharacterized protein (TIGR03382 family)
MKRLDSGILFVFASTSLAFANTAQADWPSDAGIDVPVGNVNVNFRPSVIGDGMGGAFVTFEHSDSAQSITLRGEHFDATGNRLWGTLADGGYAGKDLLGLSLGTGTSGKALGITDGNGGFITSYAPGSTSPYKLDLQRFDQNGTAQWTPTGSFGGVELLGTPYLNDAFYMIPDQQDGALLTWLDNGAYGQRVDPTGATKYGTGFSWPNTQYSSSFYSDRYMCADGWGGLYYIASTSGSASQSPELEHLDPSGTSTFNVPAATPSGAYFSEWSTVGIADGGGAWVSWIQSAALYLQFYNSAGVAVLDAGGAAGILVASVATSEPDPTMLTDGTGGTVVVWFDIVSSVNVLLGQRYAADGSPLWGSNPVVVSSSETLPQSSFGYLPSFRFIPTTDNNVAAFWTGSPSGIYGQKVAMDGGAKLWGPFSAGIAVSTVYSPQWIDATFIEDDSAFVTFQDSQNAVWIKHVNADGTLGTVDAGIDAGVDAGPDAGPDAGEDAGVDGGIGADAGSDAGMDGGGDGGNQINWPDGGDAGTGTDGGLPDSGQMADAGTSGGGCSSASGPNPMWLVAGLAILVFAGRRRLRQI